VKFSTSTTTQLTAMTSEGEGKGLEDGAFKEKVGLWRVQIETSTLDRVTDY
jgi:hypothetical protein